MKSNNFLTIGNAIMLVLILVVGYLFFKQTRKEEVVYVNTPKLLRLYNGSIQLQKVLEEKTKFLQAKVDTLGKELQNEIQKFEKERPNLSQREVKVSEELLRNKQQQFMQYQQAIQQKSQSEDDKMKDAVLIEVNSYLNEYGKSHSYKFILGATQSGNLVYADEAYDVTDEILKGLNEKHK